jgi:hypothetical protein
VSEEKQNEFWDELVKVGVAGAVGYLALYAFGSIIEALANASVERDLWRKEERRLNFNKMMTDKTGTLDLPINWSVSEHSEQVRPHPPGWTRPKSAFVSLWSLHPFRRVYWASSEIFNPGDDTALLHFNEDGSCYERYGASDAVVASAQRAVTDYMWAHLNDPPDPTDYRIKTPNIAEKSRGGGQGETVAPRSCQSDFDELLSAKPVDGNYNWLQSLLLIVGGTIFATLIATLLS